MGHGAAVSEGFYTKVCRWVVNGCMKVEKKWDFLLILYV
jgi:hypothetical protein